MTSWVHTFEKLSKLFIPFWSENPNVLLDTRYITELFPVEGMTYNQKLNAISRVIILLTLILFLYDRNTRVILISFITYNKPDVKSNQLLAKSIIKLV